MAFGASWHVCTSCIMEVSGQGERGKEDLNQKDKTVGARNGWLRTVRSARIFSREWGSLINSSSYLAYGSSDMTGRWLEISFKLLCWH